MLFALVGVASAAETHRFSAPVTVSSPSVNAFTCAIDFDVAAVRHVTPADVRVVVDVRVTGTGAGTTLKLFGTAGDGRSERFLTETLVSTRDKHALFVLPDECFALVASGSLALEVRQMPGSGLTVEAVDAAQATLLVTERDPHAAWSLAEILDPVWRTKHIVNETGLPVSEQGEPAATRLLFQPNGPVTVRSYTLGITYKEGVDYVVEGSVLRLVEGSSIPFLTRAQLFPTTADAAPGTMPTHTGGLIAFGEGTFFTDRQLAISYTASGPWDGPMPDGSAGRLSRTRRLLLEGRPVTIALFGDSISTGASASGREGRPPFVPGFGELVMRGLRARSQSPITFVNPSQGGATAAWGLRVAAASLAPDKPDLCILGFGMNDGHGTPVADYIAHVQGIMEIVRKQNPEAEFVLVASMPPNADWRSLEPMNGYLAALTALESESVAVADVWSVSGHVLKTKRYCDISANHVNHPSDFMVRIYAQVVLALFDVPATERTIHVAPGGDDAADGSAARPVRSLRRALDRAREIRAADPAALGEIAVELADGTHNLPATLVIVPEDSGTPQAPTVVRAAAGARPIVSGGRRITNWRVSEEAGTTRWMADLPEVREGRWHFTQLFVNDQRRFRPTVPADGWHTIAAALPPTPESAGKGHDRFACAADALRADWANPADVEIIGVHSWSMSRLPLRTVEPAPDDPAIAHVTLAGRTRADVAWASFPKGNRFRAENVREALGRPGSWYLDRSAGTLTYCPMPGETPETAVVVAPAVERLVELRGDVAAGRFVEHVSFEGISFAHENWAPGPEGQSFPQADVNASAAIAAVAARRVAFRGCTVRHVGRYAFEFGAGCTDCTVERCDMADLGAGGVLIGTAGGPKSWGVPGRVEGPNGEVRAIAIRDCTIAHGGRIHPAAVGVWIGHASHCAVEHCDIFDLTYSGVSVGWTWGYGESRTHHNRIAHNRIHHLGHGVLSDLGGIYTLGVSPGTVVEGNVIHDIASHTYGGWGLYTDEGSSGITLARNLVYRTTSGGFHQHYGRDNVVENNVFAAARDWQVQRSRVEDHTSFTFARNIVWWDSPAPLVKGDWTKGLVTKANCYWNASGPVTFPSGGDLAARQQAGQDEGSIVADPKFAAPATGDFTLPADSPALALGFLPLEPAQAGRRTPSGVSSLPAVPTPWPEATPAANATQRSDR